MALERNSPNLEYIKEVLGQRNMTTRQLSKLVYGAGTHRDIVKEITLKPDVRASTVLKLCRALDITMDSLYQNSDSIGENLPSINGIANVNNSSNVKIEIADLKAENKALKMLVDEKDKRLEEQKKYIDDLGHRLDLVLQLGQKTDNNK